MELSPTSDFVIRRKRKRHAVDPCLGFYTSPNSNTLFSPQRGGAHIGSCVATSPCRTEIKGLLDESSNITSPLTEPEQTNLTNTLTVEEFLKRSHNPAPSVRVYGRKRVKVVDLNASSTTGEKTNAAELDNNVISLRSRNIRRGSAPENSGLESPSPHSSPIQRKKKKIVKSLGDRLFHAAVQSGGDPIDDVVEAQDTDSFRIPLQFSPDDDCGLVSSKRRAWTLVDPRKAVPFRSATFSSRRIAPSTSSEAERQPLSRWRVGSSKASSFIGLKPQEQKVSRRTQIKSFPRRVDDRVPLSFVPLLQAETTPRRLKSNQAKTVSSLDRSGRPEQLAFEVVELNSSQANQNTEDLRPTSSASLIACAPCSPISSVHRLEKTTPVAPSLLPTCLDTASCQHSNFPEKKDLKPLASFDGFLETARVVTENETNGSLQTPCKHPSGKYDVVLTLLGPETARKSTMDWRQLMPSTLNSLQSFIRKSVKDPNVSQLSSCQTSIYTAKCSSVPRKRYPSDHIVHIPQVSNHGSVSPRPLHSGREAGDYDPDPDILTALQPQSHQVILSSSPVFNSSAPASAATTPSSPSSTALIPDNLGLKGFCQFLR